MEGEGNKNGEKRRNCSLESGKWWERGTKAEKKKKLFS